MAGGLRVLSENPPRATRPNIKHGAIDAGESPQYFHREKLVAFSRRPAYASRFLFGPFELIDAQ